MRKLSINLDIDEEKGKLVSPEQLTEIALGCLDVLNGLGPRGRLIEVFKVTFVELKGSVGPCVTVHYHDPMGKVCSYGSDFRFMGSGGPMPSRKEIADGFLAMLPAAMDEHVRRSRKTLADAHKLFRKLEGGRLA